MRDHQGMPCFEKEDEVQDTRCFVIDDALANMQEALGPVGMVKFIQQYDMGYGDYTKEKQNQPDISLEEIDVLLKK